MMTAPQRSAPRRRGAETRSRPPLRVVERAPARQPRDARRLFAVAAGLLFAAVLAGNVAIQAQTTQGQFELERLQEGAGERQGRYQRLRLEVAQLEAPERIVERAREMGMVEPAKVTYLAPTAQTSAGAPTDPTAEGPHDPAAAPRREPAPTGEAAQGWSEVKPHLDQAR